MYRSLKGLNGSQIIYKKLVEFGVEKANVFSGGAIMHLIDQFHPDINTKIDYYVHTHEQSLGHASTGYAKATGKMGVSIVTSGPGLTNMITPMVDSTNDSTSLLVLSGQVGTNAMGTNAFQECDAIALSKSATKFSYCVDDIERLPFILDAANFIANDKKKGAVHIDLPKNILNDVFKNTYNYKNNIFIDNYENELSNKDIVDMEYLYSDTIDKEYILKISEKINESKRPIIYVGQGCNNYCNLLTQFVKKTKIPVTTTLHAMGIFDENHYLSLEMLGMHGSAYANYAVQNSDLIICLGARFDDRTTGNLQKYAPFTKTEDGKNNIIHVNINPNEINNVINSKYPVISDCGKFLENIMPHVTTKNREFWHKTIYEWKKKYPFKYNECEDGKIKTQSVVKSINNYMDDDAIITTGVGSHQMMTAQFIKWKQPKKILTSGSLGVMGVGVPYAIGAQIAYPERQVIVIDGDSSFMMTMSELKTIKEYNLPIKIAIMNNHTQSMVKVWEKLFFVKRITATTYNNNPEFHKLAETFGIKSLYCNKLENLDKIVKEFLSFDGPILCEFDVKDEICLPLVRPGCGLDEMLLEKEYVEKFDSNDNEPPS